MLAASWAIGLAVQALQERQDRRHLATAPLRAFVWIAVASVLLGCAYGTHVRNAVWHTERSLWRDVVQKSPRNARGLMTYGVALMEEGDYPQALAYMQQAQIYDPHMTALHLNLGALYMRMNQMEEAGRNFQIALAINPGDDRARILYASWLSNDGHYLKRSNS